MGKPVKVPWLVLGLLLVLVLILLAGGDGNYKYF